MCPSKRLSLDFRCCTPGIAGGKPDYTSCMRERLRSIVCIRTTGPFLCFSAPGPVLFMNGAGAYLMARRPCCYVDRAGVSADSLKCGAASSSLGSRSMSGVAESTRTSVLRRCPGAIHGRCIKGAIIACLSMRLT